MLDLHSMSADPNPRTILRIEVVLHQTGLKRTMLYDLIKKGTFPQQVSLGARAVGWYQDEVEEWIRNRDLARREPARPGQVPAHKKGTVPAPKHPAKGALKAQVINPDRPKLSADSISAPAMMRPAAAGRTPRLTTDSEDGIVEAMSESEELRLLRKENAQLKKLVGELVLKNRLLQSSTGLKTSAF